jgi:hypothetical protein
MAEATKETIWIYRLLRSLDITQTFPIPIYYDNQATISLVKSREYNKANEQSTLTSNTSLLGIPNMKINYLILFIFILMIRLLIFIQNHYLKIILKDCV